MRRNASKGVAKWPKKMEQLYKVLTPCLDDHQFNKEELENDGRNVRSQLANRPEMPTIWQGLVVPTFFGP